MPSKKKFLEGIRFRSSDIRARKFAGGTIGGCFRLLIEETFDASFRGFFKFFVKEFEGAYLAVSRE